MTEYTTSSHAFREYMSARDRTARWVQSHSPTEESEFYSPSLPPSVIDGLVPSSPPSEADSSHSMPPKMVLRYNDGRPDIPIPHPGPGHAMGKQGSRGYRNSPQTSSSRVRSGSSSESPVFHPPSRHDHESSSPEEIRILPSSGEVPISSRPPSHVRSKSLPRSALRPQVPAPDVPFLPPPHLQTQTPYYDQGSAPLGPQISPPPHQVNFAQPTHPWPPRHGHSKHTPPAIVYAPSHRTHQPHYAPPAMFHHPPRMGPNGMIYSHSAPVPGQYPPAYPTPYPSVLGGSSHHHGSSAHDIRGPGGRDHTRSLGRSNRINPASSSTSLASQNSGSTYYVIPAQGQKVHVIVSFGSLIYLFRAVN